MARSAWNPWRALRDRPQTELVWQLLAGQAGAAEVGSDGREIVILDPRLGRRDRRAVLAHELVHLERELLPPGTNERVVDREEHQVRLETTRRLVPAAELERFVATRITVGAVTARVVADEFDVPVSVARHALDLLRRNGRGGE